MIKHVAFDFWQIETAKKASDFGSLLKQASGVTDLASRVKQIGDRTLRLESLKFESRVVLGDIIKLRMDELPGVASLSTPRRDLNLSNDQGVTEETAFGYDSQTGVLITQRNFYGASASVIVEYFRLLTNQQSAILCHPIVSEEGFARLQSLQVVKKLVFRVARPTRGAIAQATNGSVGQAIALLSDLDAMQVEMAVSVGRYRTSLNKRGVVGMVRDLLRLHDGDGETVDKVVVKGTDSDDQSDMFDLLEYRIKSHQEVPVDPVRRTMTLAARSSALMRAFRDKMGEIEALLQTDAS